MKLLIAFVQEADVVPVSEDLRSHGHRFTRIPSSGGVPVGPPPPFSPPGAAAPPARGPCRSAFAIASRTGAPAPSATAGRPSSSLTWSGSTRPERHPPRRGSGGSPARGRGLVRAGG